MKNDGIDIGHKAPSTWTDSYMKFTYAMIAAALVPAVIGMARVLL